MVNLIEVQCAECDKSVFRKPAEVERNKRNFCSRACSNAHQSSRAVILLCEECGVSVRRTPSDLRRVKHTFCSRPCAGCFNMRGKPSHNKKWGLHPRPKKTRRTIVEHWVIRHQEQLNTWKNGLFHPSERVCKTLLIFERGKKCEICGWAETNSYTKRIPIELEHKDGNCYNNKYENLSLLCPNHQSLTPTYRGANARKGRGRTMYKVVSQWAKEKGVGVTTGV